MKTNLRCERGTTLIETVIASAILLVVMVGLLSMAALATMYTENHGHLEARTTEYAQDKMEQLLALSYSDQQSDTTTFPAMPTGGTGMAVGGSIDPSTPIDGYVDWVGNNGDSLSGGVTPPADWFYLRVWQISTPTPGMKQIVVVATVKTALAGAMRPTSTLVVLRADKF
ncbi:MAG: hypothetical protein GEU82_07385 [Luteitalea sp.]|nr:hypothetical protein [Luteitalea sp.]